MNVTRLGAFISATEKQNDFQANLSTVHTIARSIMNAKLANTRFYPNAISKVALPHSVESNQYPRMSRGIERYQPFPERDPAILGRVLLDLSLPHLHERQV